MEYVWAFIVGGAICVLGQVLIDFTKLTPARILVLFVVTGVVLSALGLYEPIAEFAGAGATVPLTGFGYLMATGTKEAVAGMAFRGFRRRTSSRFSGNCSGCIIRSFSGCVFKTQR